MKSTPILFSAPIATDPERIKKLAAAWLEQRGEAAAPTEAA